MVVTRRQSLELLRNENKKRNSTTIASRNNASASNRILITSKRESRESLYNPNTPSHSMDSVQSMLLNDIPMISSSGNNSSSSSSNSNNSSSSRNRNSSMAIHHSPSSSQIQKGLDTNLNSEPLSEIQSMPHGSSTFQRTLSQNPLTRIMMKGMLYLTCCTFLFLLVFFYEGISMLFRYRKSFGTLAPIPISPAYGVVVVTDRDHMVEEEDPAIDPTTVRKEMTRMVQEEKRLASFRIDEDVLQNFMFPTFATTTTTTMDMITNHPSLYFSKKPIRLLFLGDSIARGVGSSVPYPILPESTAKTISKCHGGRPVFWSVFAEPGSTIKGMYMQVSQMKKDTLLLEESIQYHWRELYKVPNYDEHHDNSMSISQAKHVWMEKLHHHRELQRLNPFVGYDFVVILSGINDIKRLLVPFLFSGDDESRWIHRDGEESGFRGDLNRLIRSLNTTMLFDSSSLSSDGPATFPRFILPSFPAKQVPAKMGRILNFIGVHSTKLMDQMKQQIAAEHSQQIFAPPEMSTEQGIDYIHRRGQIWNVWKKEDVKVQLVSIGEEHARKLTEEMIEFYKHNRADRKNMPWNPLMSNDALHPNEHGYDAAGRVIGMETSNRWILN